MRRLLLCALAATLVVALSSVSAQTKEEFPSDGKLVGRVVGSTEQPIGGANISYYIEDANRANRAGGDAVTDALGNYYIEYTFLPSNQAANVGRLHIAAKSGDQNVVRGGPSDLIEVQGGTIVKVDFHFGAVSQPPPTVAIPQTNTTRAISPTTSTGAPVTPSGPIVLPSVVTTNATTNATTKASSSSKINSTNVTGQSSIPGFDAIYCLAGITIVMWILKRNYQH